MSFLPTLCRSESKVRNPVNRNPAGGRISLQNVVQRRSSSLDVKRRGSGSIPKARSSSEERKSNLFQKGSGSIPKARSSSEERKSNLFQNWNNTRRSSVNFNEGKVLKDSRPLADKAYQKKKVQDLVDFLVETSFKYEVTVNRLMQISKKDFENIFEHLVIIFDGSYVMKRIEDEAPRILKNFNYPFIPAKSAFTYVARTNIAALLGVLFFLMDMAKFALNIDTSDFYNAGGADEPKSSSLWMQYIFSSYYEPASQYNKETEDKFFEELIRTHPPFNIIDQSRNRNKELKAQLQECEDKMAFSVTLRKQNAQLISDLKQYEEYFLRMKEYNKKKKENCETMAKDLEGRESERKRLQEIRSKKQVIYDAQGFDGKKQMQYHESQKKELVERLDQKKSAFNELQDECWEIEIQHSKELDRVNAVRDQLKEIYSSMSSSGDRMFMPLAQVNDPHVKKLCSNTVFNFPVLWSDLPTKSKTSSAKDFVHSLEELKKQVNSTSLFFKGLLSAQKQRIHKLLLKKSDLSLKLKLEESEEVRKRLDLETKEKQALEELKVLENKCDEVLKTLEDLRAQNQQKQTELLEKRKNLKDALEVKANKQKMLDDYLADQAETFARYKRTLEEARNYCEASGEEITEAIERNMKKLEQV